MRDLSDFNKESIWEDRELTKYLFLSLGISKGLRFWVHHLCAKMIEELKKLFGELREILETENESNWIRGIRIICNTLENGSPEFESERFEEVKRTYASMNGGAGSFSDYYIHRDDFNDRLKSNLRLDQIRDRLWEMLS